MKPRSGSDLKKAALRPRSAGVVGALVLTFLLAWLKAARSPVADAATRQDLEAVRQLLRDGADVNSAQGDGMTALHWAAERGDVALTEVLLYAGAQVSSGTRIGHYTPLHLASRKGHLEVVDLLLQAKSNPNTATTNSGATPLHFAAVSGRAEVVSALLEAGAEVEVREASWAQTPLIFAAAHNRVDVIRVLLEAGADPAVSSKTVDTAEMEEADKAAERRISEVLTDFREQVGGGPNWKPTPSQVQAAIDGSREIQRKWPNLPKPAPGRGRGNRPQEESAQPAAEKADKAAGESEKAEPPDEVPAPNAGTPAETAAVLDNSSQPLKFDAEGNPVDDVPKTADEKQTRSPSYGQMVGHWGGLSPLLHAVRQGHREAVFALLEGGADINQPSAGDKTTPLLMAAINGQFDLALELLKRGADPNAASTVGAAPLFSVLERVWAPRASYSHPTEHEQQVATHLDVMEALMEAGADPNVRLKEHLWYMEYTFAVLRGSGINLKGVTPFWRAAHALDVAAMRLLKEYGADPGVPSLKPPQRRRRRPQEEEPKTADAAKGPDKAKNPETAMNPDAAKNPEAAKKAKELSGGEGGPAEGDDPKKTAQVKTEKASEEGSKEDDSEKDPSGIPPVPVGGPAIYPIHAASGVGYGQSYAGNAHRHVPGNWLAAVKFLVEECAADVNLRDANAYTPLHHAASRGDNEMNLYLVEKGADVTVLSRKGQTTADMANGPIQRVSPYPETIALLEKLGSKNNHKCVSC